MASAWLQPHAGGAAAPQRCRRAAFDAQALCAPVLALLLASGCSVDDRTLLRAEGSSAGSGQVSGVAGSSSSGGSKAPQPIELPVCSYADGVKPGCETIVSNAGFSEDIAPWQAEPLAINVDWASNDADDNASSGSISVTNLMHGASGGVAPGGGRQCLPTTGGAIFDMAGDVFVPEGQGEGLEGGGPYVGQAGLSILFWPSENCAETAPTKGSFNTNLVSEPGVWTRVEGSALAPEGTQSMSVRVLTVKPFQEFNFTALFDNVLVQPR